MPSQYIYDMSDTWNSGITTYTAIKMNVTDSASAADSLLVDLQIGSASKFKVDKNGSATLISSDAGASAGPVLTFWRDSASPAASDVLGKILFQGEDDAGNAEDYSEVYSLLVDPSNGSEDASLYLRTKIAGSMTSVMVLSSTGADVTGGLAATGALSGSALTLTSTDAGAGAAPLLGLTRDSASPAASDVLGDITFYGRDGGANLTAYAAVHATIVDPTDTSEDGSLVLRAMIAGSITTVATASSAGLTVTGDVLPEADGTRDLGSSSVRWAETHSDTVLTDLLRGATTAGSLPVQGEGTATTNLQQGLAKAWCLFNGTGTPAITDSFNATSLTDNGTGNYALYFISAMASANFVQTNGGQHATGNVPYVMSENVNNPNTASYWSISLADPAGTRVDLSKVMSAITGDLA